MRLNYISFKYIEIHFDEMLSNIITTIVPENNTRDIHIKSITFHQQESAEIHLYIIQVLYTQRMYN